MTAPAPLPVLVVADDHTGANATAGRLASYGVTAVTLAAGPERPADPASLPADVGAVVVSTASRHLEGQAAMVAVREVAERMPHATLLAKRIDSTLRGNVGAEIDALLRASSHRGLPATALVVAAHPDGDRTTVGGVQLVGGAPLAATETAADPREPVHRSRVAAVLGAQLDRTVAEVGIDVVRDGGDVLAAALSVEADVVVADAVDDGDLVCLAGAAVEASRRWGRRWLPCDPGPFTAAYADAAGVLGRPAGPVLAVCGSVTAVTREQLATLRRRLRTTVVDVDVDAFDAVTLGAALAEAAQGDAIDVVAAATAAAPARLRDLDAAHADRVAAELGRAVAVALDAVDVAGLYLTGGDITAGVLAALAADGLTVEREVLPLAVIGRVFGGPQAGTLVATKGGLVGGPDAAARCVQELRAAARRRPERSSTP